MKPRLLALSILFAFLALPLAALAQSGDSVVGTPGWLIIHGGGVVTNEVKERFLALAGGPNANVVMIPTAMRGDPDSLDRRESQIAHNWHIENFTVLHTRDRVRANSEGFVDPLKHATVVWIDGGRQWRLADAYLNTGVEREIKAVLARGGVVFGSSAGASIQASFLVRGAPGTPRNPDGDNRIMISPGHEVGFGLLPNSAIDQHIDARDRANDLEQVIRKHPGLLGIGIDQSAAIIVHGGSFFVVGGQVAIHDGRNHNGAPYYYLSSGQAFDLATRSIIDPGDEGYTSTLRVESARRFATTGLVADSGTLTEGTGLLELEGGSDQQVNFRCDNISLYSIGGNRYPARQDRPNEITIRARKLNSDVLESFTCRIGGGVS